MATVAIVGNRDGFTKEYVNAVLDKVLTIKLGQDKVISGGANGVDTYAMEWARNKGVSFRAFMPDMSVQSPARYFQRNEQIAKACDVLVAFNAHAPSGTLNTVNTATKLGKEVIVIGKDFPI